MRLTRKRGVVALSGAIAVGLAVAIPMVGASVTQAGPSGLAPSAATPKPAAVFTGTCLTTKSSWASNDALSSSTSSTGFSTVPGMSVNFTTGSTCATITFSAFTFAAEDNGELDALMHVRALVDGNVCLPGEVQFSGDDDEDVDLQWARSHSFTFVCTFPAGHHTSHTAVVQFRNGFSGDTVFAHRPTMVVEYH